MAKAITLDTMETYLGTEDGRKMFAEHELVLRVSKGQFAYVPPAFLDLHRIMLS